MQIDKTVLRTYELIFLSAEITYILIFVLNNFFAKIIFLELTYGYGFYLLLSLFIAWAVLLKASGNKNLTSLGALIIVLLIIPVIDRLILLIGALSFLTVGSDVLVALFLLFIFIAIALFFYSALKGSKSQKFRLKKFDIMFILVVLSIALVLILIAYTI